MQIDRLRRKAGDLAKVADAPRYRLHWLKNKDEAIAIAEQGC